MVTVMLTYVIKAVIFDFAGVIGLEGYWLWLEENIADLAVSKEYFMHLSQLVDRGDITEKNFVSALAIKSGKSPETIWPEIFKKIVIDPRMLELINKLKKNYKVGLLTNFVENWILEIIERYQLSVYFNTILISSEQKLIKPEPGIFRLMLKELAVTPGEAVFIDDRETNIQGAEELGINGVTYTSFELLEAELCKLGVLY